MTFKKSDWLAWKFQYGFCKHEFEAKSPGAGYAMLVYCPECSTSTGQMIENAGGDIRCVDVSSGRNLDLELGPNNLDHPEPGVPITIAEICPADVVNPTFANGPRPCVVCTPTPRQNTLVFSVAQAFEYIDREDYHARLAVKQHFMHCLAPRGLWLVPHPDLEG